MADSLSEAFPTRREAVERAADALVREHRFTVAVVFPAVGAVTLLARALFDFPGPLAALENGPLFAAFLLFGTAVMRLPLIAGVLPEIDRRAALAIAAVTVYAYAIELVGVRTGWPYGDFTYQVDLGPMLFGEIPLGLPIFFLPLVLNSYLLVTLLLGDRAERRLLRLAGTVATVLVVDLVLDPGAVAVGFWRYEGAVAGVSAAGYYGVPWSNYGGWVLSATVATVLFDLGFDHAALVRRVRDCEFVLDDLVSFVILWGTINVVFGNWIAVGLALGLGAGLLWTDRFDFDLSGSRLVRAVRR